MSLTRKICALLACIGVSWSTNAKELKNADHWAYHPPSEITEGDLDSFITKRLRAVGLASNPQADRRTLIRRLTFDLRGLPPTPQEVAAFLADKSDGAIPNLIDRLLKSPRYGERWARHWLDVARFSESQGFERDKIRPDAWHYRDYVIRSFNDDKPYDQFVREQIAGDVIEPVTQESIKATGFLVAGPWDEVGNGQRSKLMRMVVREEELEDVISAVGQTFLGVTINCARCHDHKFDPIPQHDYYAVKAIFEGVYHGTRTYLTPPEVKQREMETGTLRAQLAQANQRHREMKLAALQALAKRGEIANATPAPYLRWTFEDGATDLMQGLTGQLRDGAKIRNGRLILDGKRAHLVTSKIPKTLKNKTFEGWVQLNDLNQRRGALISIHQSPGNVFDALVFAERKPRAWMAGSDFFRRTTDLKNTETVADRLVHVAITYADSDRISVYRNGRLIGSYTARNPLVEFAKNTALIYLGRRTGSGYLKGEIEEVRVYDQALTADEIRTSFENGPARYSKDQIASAMTARERAEFRSLQTQRKNLAEKIADASERPLVYAARPRQPQPTPFLIRGEITKKGEIVKPRALVAVTSLKSDLGLRTDSPDADRRRRFAEWVTHPDNPLTARVMVNRVWHYHFGRGLVDTPSDFGVSGSRPSHPELLDWLAEQFVRDGWSLKQLHRRILNSATYLQSSSFNEQAAESDADNRLLWRFTPKRLEAEAARDSMLALSGQMNWQMGGPGYRPFDLEINNTHFYHTKDKIGPEFNRRTIYRVGVQSLREPLLDSLDCPDLSTKTPVRGVTTTPIQALALMNDSFVQRQAKFFSERLRADVGNNLRNRIRLAYRLAFGRPASLTETKRAESHARKHGLEQLCWVLLNSNEFIYVR